LNFSGKRKVALFVEMLASRKQVMVGCPLPPRQWLQLLMSWRTCATAARQEPVSCAAERRLLLRVRCAACSRARRRGWQAHVEHERADDRIDHYQHSHHVHILALAVEGQVAKILLDIALVEGQAAPLLCEPLLLVIEAALQLHGHSLDAALQVLHRASARGGGVAVLDDFEQLVAEDGRLRKVDVARRPVLLRQHLGDLLQTLLRRFLVEP
jgi:hypothetical protein